MASQQGRYNRRLERLSNGGFARNNIELCRKLHAEIFVDQCYPCSPSFDVRKI